MDIRTERPSIIEAYKQNIELLAQAAERIAEKNKPIELTTKYQDPPLATEGTIGRNINTYA